MNITVAKNIETNLHILLAQKKLDALRVMKEQPVDLTGLASGLDEISILAEGGEISEEQQIDPKEQEKQEKEQAQIKMSSAIFELGPEGIDKLLEQFRMPRSNNITESIEELVDSQSPELLQGAIDLVRGQRGQQGEEEIQVAKPLEEMIR